MIKKLIICTIALTVIGVKASDVLSEVMLKEVPNVKQVSADIYKRLHSGFRFKGYDKSPGHQAVLTEMRNYYQLVKAFDAEAKAAKSFPQESFGAVKKSQERITQLVSFVLMDDDVTEVFKIWEKTVNEFSRSKEQKEKELEVKKLEIETEKLEKAIEAQEEKVERALEEDIAAKEARLRALEKHYKLIQQQNNTIIRAGYTTPSGYFPDYNGGYYYNNGTFYPKYNRGYRDSRAYCPLVRRSLIQIKVK